MYDAGAQTITGRDFCAAKHGDESPILNERIYQSASRPAVGPCHFKVVVVVVVATAVAVMVVVVAVAAVATVVSVAVVVVVMVAVATAAAVVEVMVMVVVVVMVMMRSRRRRSMMRSGSWRRRRRMRRKKITMIMMRLFSMKNQKSSTLTIFRLTATPRHSKLFVVKTFILGEGSDTNQQRNDVTYWKGSM